MDRSSGTGLSPERVSRLKDISVALSGDQGDVAVYTLLRHWNKKDAAPQTPVQGSAPELNC